MISEVRLRQCIDCLRAGGIIAYPTEGVWGLGCDPDNVDAVERLLHIKRRSWTKGLILVAADREQIHSWHGDLDQEHFSRLSRLWPGPCTVVLPASARVPRWVRGQHETQAFRVSAHPVVVALSETWGGPLVSTSANHSGQPAARTLQEVRIHLGRDVDAYLPGQLGSLKGATPILDLTTGRQIRI
ncbi:MAG: threonylcarbamoyl-AMP synthase [Pseudomonadales bacterium]|nr:threonylcarbamoyl-AMP synthase [Pseudomonadales bacterium]